MGETRRMPVRSKEDVWTFTQRNVPLWDILDFFPPYSVGPRGPGDEPRPYEVKPVLIETDLGFAFETDIQYGSWVFRPRSPKQPGMMRWCRERGIEVGDAIVFERVTERRYRLSLEKGASEPADSPLIEFHRGSGRDDRGRALAEILGWSDERLESVHDYIQWMFPLDQPSGANPGAPILTAADIATFRSDPDLRRALERSFDRFLAFLGLECVRGGPTPVVRRTLSFARRKRVWLHSGSHNYLRVTRVLGSLRLLGLETLAGALFDGLEEIWAEESAAIGERTHAFWRAAAGRR